jgi:membrane fusion protein (multidrug efflux system)
MSSEDNLIGYITGEIISVRFAFSGKISKVNVKAGDHVTRGQILSSLDRTQLQMELDKELKDFERIRADFEIFVKKQGDDASDLARFEKIRQQSLLDVSVKAVELAKSRLDQADLISVVEGTVISNGGLRTGMYITPGANPVDILDSSSLVFMVPVEWEDLGKFVVGSQFKVQLVGIPDEIPAAVMSFIPPADPKKSPQINFKLDTTIPVFPGLPGKILFLPN